MPTSSMSGIVHDLRRAVLRDGGGQTDGQLLDLFVHQRDEAALAALVRRHAPMVWGVCRRMLSSHHDAEDAFQATFLVLVRKAAAIRHKDLVANWLYGVAQQIAVRARVWAAKHGRRERQVTEMPESAVTECDVWESLQPVLDEELARLPEKYRALLVLCDLEGKTRKEAAQELACPEGTVAGRLARARAMLATRLARRGIAVSSCSLAALLSAPGASASVPSVVVFSTIQAATLFAAGHATASAISANAVALSEGVLKAMLISKLKLTAALFVMVGALALSGGLVAQRSVAGDLHDENVQAAIVNAGAISAHPELLAASQTQRPQPKDGATVTGKLDAIDAEKNSVTITTVRRGESPTSKTYTLAKDAKVLRDGKDVKLGDLKAGVQAALKLAADQKSAVSLSVNSPAIAAPLKSVDAAKNTITVTVGNRAAREDKTYQVAKDAKITIDGKESGFADLKAGAVISIVVNDANTVIQIRVSTRGGIRKQDG